MADPLFLAHYIEQAGTGTLEMIALSREAGLRTPDFRQDGGSFVQTLWRPEPPAPQVTPQASPQDKSLEDSLLSELATALGVPTPQAIVAFYHRALPAFMEITGVADSDSLPPPEKPGFMSSYKTYEMLPVGTRIRVTKVHRFYAYMDVGSMELIDAKMASGPHQGTDVKIDAICKTVDSPTLDKGLLVRDRDILSETPTKS